MNPTEQQTQRWLKFEVDVRRLNLKLQAVGALSKALAASLEFGKRNQVEPPIWPHPGPYERLSELSANVRRVNRIVKGANDEKLGVQFFTDGEISILAPPGSTKDELQYWQSLDIAPVLIGIAVIAGAVAYAALLYSKLSDLEEDYKKLGEFTHAKYCQVPGSPLCQRWLRSTEKNKVDSQKSLAEKFNDAAESLGQSLTTGTKYGLALLIPLIGFLLWSRRK